MPLTVKSKHNSNQCSHETSCKRKAKWKCPSGDCPSGIGKHFKTFSLASDTFIVKQSQSLTTNSEETTTNEEETDTSTDFSDPESDVDDFSFVNHTTDAGLTGSTTEYTATDFSDVACVMDQNYKTLPMHILLNRDCHVLQTHRFRNDCKNISKF